MSEIRMSSDTHYTRLRQVVVAANDIQMVVEVFENVLGLRVCERSATIIDYGLVNAVLSVNGMFLEIVSPAKKGSAVERFLEKSNGIGGYMLCLDTSYMSKVKENIKRNNYRMVIEKSEASGDSIQVHPRDVGGTLLAIDQQNGSDDVFGYYAYAREDWQKTIRTDVTVGIESATISGPDYHEVAERWSQLLDRPLEVISNSQSKIPLEFGSIEFSWEPHLAASIFTGIRLSVRRPERVIENARKYNCPIDGNAFFFSGIWFSLVENGQNPVEKIRWPK